MEDVASVVVAHEALHRFFGWHGTHQAADEGIMDASGSAIRQSGTRQLTDLQFRMIQKTLFPK